MDALARVACVRANHFRPEASGRKAGNLVDRSPTDSSGVPVEGIPVGTAFVRILGNSVDPDGNVQVRLLGAEAVVVSIDAGQLGLP
jgi:hypothetical protein